MDKCYFNFLTLAFSFFFIANGTAQIDILNYQLSDTLEVAGDFFDVEAPFECTLEFDIKSYQRSRKEAEYLEAKLSYFDHSNNLLTTREVKLKARGDFRMEHCTLPPLWLNISKTEIAREEFHDAKKVKVVTHCKNSKSYQAVLLKEFLAYAIYNLISPYSFRVRLMKIRYIDTGRENKEYINWAFVIEPEEIMAERLYSTPFRADNISRYQTSEFETDVMALANFMMGNADYSIMGRHNIKLLKLNDPLYFRPIPVPYDFDYSGIVNATYAVPSVSLGTEKITERYFIGPCRSEEEYQKAIDIIENERDEIFKLLNTFPYIDEKTRVQLTEYITEFYNLLNKSLFIDLYLKSTCLQ